MKVFTRLLVVCACLASLYLSYRVAVYISEYYFFDRMYYQKSSLFGYMLDDSTVIENLESRMNGWKLLYPEINLQKQHDKQENTAYRIAVIGDSLVWGMGIKKEKRFSEILQKKLNKIRPTEVYAVGKPGDNFLDNLSKIMLLEKNAPQDLYIFIVFINDILVWPETRYFTQPQQQIIQHCGQFGPYAYDGDFSDNTLKMETYQNKVELAWKNPANLCTISEGVKHLPKNALYLIVDNHSESADYDAYVALLETMDLTVESISRSSPGIEEYSKYFEHPEKHFSVSERERHPSALANRMIADYLYRRITTDDAWRFVEQ